MTDRYPFHQSSTAKPLIPKASAKRPTAVRLALVRSASRRERTGSQREPAPPRRIARPHYWYLLRNIWKHQRLNELVNHSCIHTDFYLFHSIIANLFSLHF